MEARQQQRRLSNVPLGNFYHKNGKETFKANVLIFEFKGKETSFSSQRRKWWNKKEKSDRANVGRISYKKDHFLFQVFLLSLYTKVGGNALRRRGPLE